MGMKVLNSVGLCGGLKEILEVKVLWKLENAVAIEDIILMTSSSLEH